MLHLVTIDANGMLPYNVTDATLFSKWSMSAEMTNRMDQRDTRSPSWFFRSQRQRGTEPLRGLRLHFRAKELVLVAASARIQRAGLHGRGRLYGPRQLSNRHRRRVEIRLHAALGDHDLQSDRHSAASVGGAARDCRRP